MGDQPRVHPVTPDVEAPAAPLVPPGSTKSEYVAAGAAKGARYLPPPRRKRSCCCRLFCCVFSLLLSLVIIIGILVGVFFLVFHPKLPKYSIDKLAITQFYVSNNSSLQASFNVAITARNPNKKIGIYYESGSNIAAWYESTKLCEGSLPKFYQGHRNTTILNVTLTGQTDDASGLESTIVQQLQQTGRIPLRIKAKQPVKIKLGKLKLMKMNFRVRCKLYVTSSLDVNSSLSFTDSSCSFRLRF